MLSVAFKSVPVFTRYEVEEAQIGRNFRRVPAFPRAAIHRFRHEGAQIPAVLQDQLARFDTVHHAIHPHVAATLAFVHTGVDVQRSEQRIKRAGGRVHHKGIIQPLMRNIALLSFDVAVFLMDLRGLREAGLLLMHGLGDQDPRIVFVQLQQQRRAVGHHRNKLLITHPGRVKQDVITQVSNLINHLTGVIDGAIVGAQLDHRQTERTRIACTARRHLCHQLAQITFFKAVGVNAANKAVRVARGFQIDRRCTGLEEGTVMVRFVVVTVEQHQVARGEQGVKHHFVG